MLVRKPFISKYQASIENQIQKTDMSL